MAKMKNKKKNQSDHVHTKKEAMNKKVMNPFEVHVNKEKMRVIGKKDKNDRGLPGVSRAKALEKRKHTLLQEYKQQNKSNKFTDKRIGEQNRSMTNEDKLMARFTAVRVNQHKKKSIFNLADDEVLTHRGQTLSEIEKFDNPRSDDESEDEQRDSGNLNKKFVEDVHFGGGILTKTGKDGARTHRELIDQLIAESKKRKAEKQKTKEATLELTEKLDTEWKDLLPIVNKSKKTNNDPVEKAPVDDYDKVMRELRFEARGTVSDRLKTQDEVAKEEKEKLEQLEKERLERMKGYVEDKTTKQNHRSADDLDDDFVYDSDPEYMLSYNQEGESNVVVNAEMNGKNLTGKEDVEESEADSGNEDEEKEDDEEEELETDSEDNMSDLKEDSSDSSDEETNEIETIDNDVIKPITVKVAGAKTVEKTNKFDNKPTVNETNEVDNDNVDTHQNKIKADLLLRKDMMEKAREELPYTFALPDSYESLQKTLENHSSDHQSVILERMIKCNHPSLGKGNKDSLGLLFAYLLQYLNDLASEATDEKSVKLCFEIFSILVPQIYELAQLNPENAHNSLVEVIKEKHSEYRKKAKQYPGLEILLFLKLVSVLFTTSDFRHQLVTPSLVFMEQMLCKCRVKSQRDISYGLFLATLVLEYTSLSKRYSPATINFLSGLLHMAIPKTGVRLIRVVSPFKPISNQLVLLSNYSQKDIGLKMLSTDLLNAGEFEEEFKIRAITTTIQLLEEFFDNLKQLSSSVEILEPILKYLQLIPIKSYPEQTRNVYCNLVQNVQNLKVERKLEFVVMEAKKPKSLRLYEPKIVEVYDGKRFKVQSREKAERDKMLHKLKKEKKGALREIRRDKSFLGRVKITQQIKSDKERRDKVKRIYAEAADQQSELNAIDRKKKRK